MLCNPHSIIVVGYINYLIISRLKNFIFNYLIISRLKSENVTHIILKIY